MKRYNNKVDMTWSSNDSSVTERQLFLMLTQDAEDVFKEVYVRSCQGPAPAGLLSLRA